MKLIILILVVFILHNIFALIPKSVNKDVGSQLENTDKNIVQQKSVILTSNNRKTKSGGSIRRNTKENTGGRGGPIRRNTKQNTTSDKKPDTSKNERYHPYQKPVTKKPEVTKKNQVILSVPQNQKFKKPDSRTIEDFQAYGSPNTATFASSMDYVAINIIDPYERFKKDWRYLPQWLGHGILYYDKKLEKINNKFYAIRLKGKMLAMPFASQMYNGHSTCLIVDMNLKTVEFYDSTIQNNVDDYSYYCTAGKEYFNRWKLALKRRNLNSKEKIDVNGWKFIQPKFKTRQQNYGDPPDCSIYVIMFIDGRMNGDKRVIKSDNSTKVRKALYKVFMQNITKKPSKFKIF